MGWEEAQLARQGLALYPTPGGKPGCVLLSPWLHLTWPIAALQIGTVFLMFVILKIHFRKLEIRNKTSFSAAQRKTGCQPAGPCTDPTILTARPVQRGEQRRSCPDGADIPVGAG